jgi:hypothetical protein
MKEAAAFLAAAIAKPEITALASPAKTVPATIPENKKAGLDPLTYLQPEHPAVQALRISPETASHFGAGYAPKGIMRGRLAIPIHDANGQLLAYCGRAVGKESQTLIFPSGFIPAEVVFNAHRVVAGSLYLMRDVVAVLKGFERGIDNSIAFLTETVSSAQFRAITFLMDERKCGLVEIN